MFLNLAHAKLVVFGAGHKQSSYQYKNDLADINKNIILVDNNKDENPDFVLDIKDKFKLEEEFYQQNIGFPDNSVITSIVFEQLPGSEFSPNMIIK